MTLTPELNFPNPVETRDDLFDRDQEVRQIEATLRLSTRRPIVIMGERVMGKTSLLNIVRERAAQDRQLVPIQLPHADSPERFAEEILDGMAGELGSSLHRLGLRDDRGEFRLTTVAEFARVATELSSRPGAAPFLLCLEELDSMLVNCPDDTAANRILDLVLYLVDKTSTPVRFVFTMTQMAPHILRSHASQFMSAASIVSLAPWTFEESRALVEWLLKGAVTLDVEAHRQVFSACGGHPYLTKALVRTLLELHAGSPAGAPVTAEHVRSAVWATVRLPELDFTLDNIARAHFSAEEARLLRHIATRGGSVSAAELELLCDSCPGVAHELHRRNYLRADRAASYSQSFGLLAAWLKGRPATDIPPFETPAAPAAPAAAAARPATTEPAADLPLLVIDDVRKRAFLGEREVPLTAQEYRFLHCLAEHAGSVVDRYKVATEVWPDEVVDGVRENRLDALISRLRKEFGSHAMRYIETRRGRGFYLDPDLVRRVPPRE